MMRTCPYYSEFDYLHNDSHNIYPEVNASTTTFSTNTQIASTGSTVTEKIEKVGNNIFFEHVFSSTK